jgi:small subunit ribosomal protein S8
VNWRTAEKSLELKKQVGNMLTDPISDLLTRLRNASAVNKALVEVPVSKIKLSIAKILLSEGYLANVEQYQDGGHNMMRITLKYSDSKEPAITQVKRVSKPGLRIYKKFQDLRSVRSGYGLAIVSTSNGLMTSIEAKKRHLGGEVICEIF